MDNPTSPAPSQDFGNETPDVIAFLELARQISDRIASGNSMGAMALLSPAKSAAEKIVDRTKRQDAQNALRELQDGLQQILNQNSPHI